MKRQYSPREFELVFDRLDALDRRMEQMNRPQSNVVGFLDFVARLATAPPRADGHLQFSEVLTGMALVGGSWLVGAFGSWITGDPELVRFTTRIGCYGCLALWALDVFNPAGIWDETIGRFLDGLAERTAELMHNEPDKPQVRLLPVYHAASSKPKTVIVESPPEPLEYELPDDRVISVPDLIDFVTTAAREGWARDYWMKQGMEKPIWYALREELSRDGIKVWGGDKDSPTLKRFVRALIDQVRTGRDGRDGTRDDEIE